MFFSLDMQESKNNALKFDASPVFLENTASARPVEVFLENSSVANIFGAYLA